MKAAGITLTLGELLYALGPDPDENTTLWVLDPDNKECPFVIESIRIDSDGVVFE